MLRPRIAWVPFLFPVLLFACVPGSLRAQTEIDLALVLAVDASRSMDPDERELQRQGYVEAFRSPMLHRAIQRGVLGQVAVTYIDWSDASDQRIVVPWTLIRQPDEALNFAERLAGMSMQRVLGSTSISGAIDFSRHLQLQLITGAVDAVRPRRLEFPRAGDGGDRHHDRRRYTIQVQHGRRQHGWRCQNPAGVFDSKSDRDDL